MKIFLLLTAIVLNVAAGSRFSPSEADAAQPRRDAARTIRILPIGDSITQGGRTDRAEYTYRYPLYFMLKNAGYAVDFIGSLRTGLQPDAVWPNKDGEPFDLDHEGHYGWTTAQVRDRLQVWMAKYPGPADIALIQLGSNDVDAPSYEKVTIDPLTDIIGMLRRQNPNTVVLVGHLMENGRKARATRPLFERLLQLNTPMSPVVTVHHYQDWNEKPGPDSDTFDWAHPNPKGQKKMADKWFAAMKPFLERLQNE